MEDEDVWINNLEKVKKYINKNKKIPSATDADTDIVKLYRWILNQQVNYTKEKGLIQNENMSKQWKKFVLDYDEYFTTVDGKWFNTLEKVKKYIDENNKRPCKNDTDENIKKIALWISTQIQNYKKKENIMKDDIVREEWNKFITSDKYKNYFTLNEDEFIKNLNEISDYIDNNNKKPSETENENTKKMYTWINHHLNNYKNKSGIMKNDIINTLWKDFITKYKIFFMSNDEIWYYNLELAKKYIDNHKKKPSDIYNDKNIKKLGSWIVTQRKNYKKNDHIMKDEIIKKEWENFITSDKYKNYFK